MKEGASMMGSEKMAGAGCRHKAKKQGNALRACLIALVLLMAFGSGCTMSHQTIVSGPEYRGLDVARSQLSPAQQAQQEAGKPLLREKTLTKESRQEDLRVAGKSDMPVPAPVMLHFKTGSAGGFDAAERAGMERMAEFLEKHPDTRIRIEGHTDSVGQAAYNLKLSRERAESVRQLLARDFAVAAGRMDARGFGEEHPLADNATAEGRAKNRRVMLVLLDAQGVALAPGAVLKDTAPPPAAVVYKPLPVPKVQRPDQSAMNAALSSLRQEASRKKEIAELVRYEIEISVQRRRLWLYEISPKASRRLVKSYTLSLPRPGQRIKQGPGEVASVEYHAPPQSLPRFRQEPWQLRSRMPNALSVGQGSGAWGHLSLRLSSGSEFTVVGQTETVLASHAHGSRMTIRAQEAMLLAKAIAPGAKVVVLR